MYQEQADNSDGPLPSASQPSLSAQTSIAWLLIAAVWVATPFMGDDVPPVLSWGYVALTAVAVIFGAVVAIRRRAWFLLAAAVLTAFAWPIVLFGIFALFSFN